MVEDSFFLFQLNGSVGIQCRTYNPFHAQQKKRANKTGGDKCQWEQEGQVDDGNVHGKEKIGKKGWGENTAVVWVSRRQQETIDKKETTGKVR